MSDLIQINERLSGMEKRLGNLEKAQRETDKEIARNTAMYETIITNQTEQSVKLSQIEEGLASMREKFAVNDYKTNRATQFLQGLTYGKIFSIGAVILTLIAAWKT